MPICLACSWWSNQLASHVGWSHVQVLQMVGRAGRPQFDDEGVAVIMTSKDSTYRYQKMMAGQVRSGQLTSDG